MASKAFGFGDPSVLRLIERFLGGVRYNPVRRLLASSSGV